MDTTDLAGAQMHSEDAEARRQAAALLGRAKTERKAASSRENGKKSAFTEEMREKLRASQKARRERERAAKAATGLISEAENA